MLWTCTITILPYKCIRICPSIIRSCLWFYICLPFICLLCLFHFWSDLTTCILYIKCIPWYFNVVVSHRRHNIIKVWQNNLCGACKHFLWCPITPFDTPYREPHINDTDGTVFPKHPIFNSVHCWESRSLMTANLKSTSMDAVISYEHLLSVILQRLCEQTTNELLG